MTRSTRPLLAVPLALGIVLASLSASPAGATLAPGRARTGVSGVQSLDSVACPTTARCVAVGTDENLNGKSAIINVSSGAATPWSGVLEDQDPNAVACPTATTCLTVSDDVVATVKVSTGAMRVTATLKLPTNGIVALDAIACASRNSCYAVGFQGPLASADALIVHLSASGKVLGETTGTKLGIGIGTIACPSRSLCLFSIHTSTGEWIERLKSGHPGVKNPVPSNTYIQALTCYKAKVCFALAGSDSAQRTDELFPINPKTGSLGAVRDLGGFSGDGIACASAVRCLIAGFLGTGSKAKTAVIVVTKGKPGKPTVVSGSYLSGIACATSTVCYAVGGEASGGLVERV